MILLLFCILTLGTGLVSFLRKLQTEKNRNDVICHGEDLFEKDPMEEFCLLPRLDAQGAKTVQVLTLVKKRYEKLEKSE